MTRTMTAAVIIGLFFAQSPESRVQGPGHTVHIETVVERPEGSFVGGLTCADFLVTVDNLAADVEECAEDNGPVTVVVMIDITASTLWPGLGRAEFARPFTDSLLAQFGKDDRIRVASFARRVVMAGAFTSNQRLMRDALLAAIAPRENERTGPSPIWDALDAAITALEPEPGRRAVILMTDGKSTGNQKSLSEVADRAIALGIPVSTVIVGGPMLLSQSSSQIALVRPGLALERLSAATGGLAVEMLRRPVPGQPSQLTTSALALRRAYRITIATRLTDGRFHTVLVGTRDGTLRVRARAAFLAPGTDDVAFVGRAGSQARRTPRP